MAGRDQLPDVQLLAAPVKRTPFDYLVQKATELGVASIRPVITRRTIVDRVNAAVRKLALNTYNVDASRAHIRIIDEAGLRQLITSTAC